MSGGKSQAYARNLRGRVRIEDNTKDSECISGLPKVIAVFGGSVWCSLGRERGIWL